MHLFRCPHCQRDLPVSTTQAGETIRCEGCQAEVTLPRLGELRRLPAVDGGERQTADDAGPPMGARVAFGIFGGVAAIALVVAAFAAVQALAVDVPRTTESHIEEIRETYSELTAAELIREYEDIQRYGIDLAIPLNYRVAELSRRKWLVTGGFALGIALAASLVAAATVAAGRQRPGGLSHDGGRSPGGTLG